MVRTAARTCSTRNRIHTLSVSLVLCAVLTLTLQQGAFASHDCRSAWVDLKSFRTLISEAETIVLATASTAAPTLFGKDEILNFIFDVDETLKGYQRRPLKIKAQLTDDDPRYPRGDLDAHTRMSFWDRVETRLVHVSSCRQELNFKLGKTYLLIDPEDKIDAMSVRFEVIDDADADLWLSAVRRMIKDEREEPMTLTLDQYIKAQQSVVFAVMPFCNEKLRSGASRVAEISEPLKGSPIDRDGIHPEIFAEALVGCQGFTALLGLFYQPDKSRPRDAAPGSIVYPGQRYTRLDGEILHIDRLHTEVNIIGPKTVTLSELIVALRAP